MQRISIFAALLVMALVAFVGYENAPVAIAASTPSVGVSGVSVTPNPALRPVTSENVSASVTATYDSPSDNTTTDCNGKKQTITHTVVAVSNQSLTVTASDGVNSAALTSASSPNTGTYTGSLPTAVPDGKYTVNVTAVIAEDVTTTVTTTVNQWSTAGCTGTMTPGTPSTTTNQQQKTANSPNPAASTTYVVDEVAPTFGNPPNVPVTTVQQGAGIPVHILVLGGSAGTSYSWTATATNGSTTYSFTDTGTFGASGNGDGIAPPENGLDFLNFPCSAPLGTYSVTVSVNAVDLGGNPWPTLTASAPTIVTVTPGVSLEASALVVAEVPGGDYATIPSPGFNIVTGSEHTALVVNFAGACAGQSTVDLGAATLTLPPGFSFDKTGASPQVHWFLGPAAPGFDYHYPVGYTEVTAKPAISVSGSTATVDLSRLGTISTSNAVYLRAHVKWVGPGTPPSDNVFVDTVTATAFNGSPSPSTATSSYDVTYP